jgi:hypothetical protein
LKIIIQFHKVLREEIRRCLPGSITDSEYELLQRAALKLESLGYGGAVQRWYSPPPSVLARKRSYIYDAKVRAAEYWLRQLVGMTDVRAHTRIKLYQRVLEILPQGPTDREVAAARAGWDDSSS